MMNFYIPFLFFPFILPFVSIPDISYQSLYQQGLFYAEKNQHIQAVTCFAKFISQNHTNQFQLNDVERCRKQFAKSLIHLEGQLG